MTNSATENGIVPWPNRREILDGVTPTVDVPQDPRYFINMTDEDFEMEMDD